MPAPTAMAGRNWGEKWGAKCPKRAEQVLGAGHRGSSPQPCRWFSLTHWNVGLGQLLRTVTKHCRSGTQTCGWLQLLQDGGDSQLLLLRGGTQVLVVQQLEQNTELWKELV